MLGVLNIFLRAEESSDEDRAPFSMLAMAVKASWLGTYNLFRCRTWHLPNIFHSL